MTDREKVEEFLQRVAEEHSACFAFDMEDCVVPGLTVMVRAMLEWGDKIRHTLGEGPEAEELERLYRIIAEEIERRLAERLK